MLLKSIKLKNFRQFIDTELHFSTDKDKNVTFILANNYTGKTTLASAFTWCLFGEAGLPGALLNRKVQNELNLREEASAEVEIELQYGEQDYYIRRIQKYSKQGSMYSTQTTLRPEGTSLYITYKDKDGETKSIEPNKVQDTLNLIVPQDLSAYLFMKAEQISDMGQNVQYSLENRTTNSDFAGAVKKILGLQAIENAIKHLVKQQNSTLSLFQKKYNGNSNSQIERLRDQIEEIKEKICKNQDYLKQAESDLVALNIRNSELTAEIKQWEDGAKRQNEIDRLQNRIDAQETVLANAKNQYLSEFSRDIPIYLLQHIVPNVLSILKKTKIEDKNIPNINNKTIEYLLKREKCICDAPCGLGTEAHNVLVKLLDYVPPKYIGATVSEYIAEAKTQIAPDRMPNIPLKFEQYKKLQLQLQAQIDQDYDTIEELRKGLKEHKDTAKYEQERSRNQETISNINRNMVSKSSANVQYESELRSIEQKLEKVSQEDAANKHITDCIQHVKVISNVLNQHLTGRETELRTLMVEKMNQIYSDVFTSDYKINLSENYKITITDNNGELIGLSGAQSIFVFLSFITSVLYFAQQIHYNRIKDKVESKFLVTEPYPLVLDAPFSAFDTDNTKKACKQLPELTEQIIIFSKDLEGLLIKDQLKDLIGKYYVMNASTLDGNQRDVLETNVEEGDINADVI